MGVLSKTMETHLRSLPKVELHRHLDCSLRWSTAIEIARTLPQFQTMSLTELEQSFLITEPFADLDSVLRKFTSMRDLLQSAEILERLAFEVCEDAVNDGVRILELRFSPTFVAEANPQLKPDQILNAFLRGIARAERTWPIAVGLILIFQRTKTLGELLALRDWALDRREDFVGVDLADSEDRFEPSQFQSLFQPLRGTWPITIHAGETIYPNSSAGMRGAVELLGAQRIGHGIQAIRDPSLLQFLRDRQIILEVCPWSNHLTKSVNTYSKHPLKKLLEAGQFVTLNTDDPGVFASNLIDEYHLAQALGVTIQDFAWMNDVACAGSFLSAEKISRVWPRPRQKLSDLLSTASSQKGPS